MRGIILLLLACVMVVGGVVQEDAAAAQRTQSRKTKGGRPGQDEAYSLEDIMDAPKEFQEREVLFYARFATTANLFKNVNTRFNSNSHVNFAVWPDKARLWEEKDRKDVLPTLYVLKNDPDNVEILRKLRKYELIAIYGEVQNVYAGYPWILVTRIERIENPSDRLCEQVIEHMQNGHEALRAEHGGAAARHYEQALQFGLPMVYRAKAYEQLAQAYLLDNRLDRARGYLRQAVEMDRSDPILHLALADVALRMGDAGEALAHSQFALERSGRYPQVYGIKGEAQSLLCEFGKAFADLNTAAGTPGITPRERAMISVRRARIYTRADRYPDAARVYAAASEPGEPLGGEAWLHNEIGLFYEKLYLESDDGRYLDSAYTAFEEASRLSRLDPAILYSLAEVEYRRQRLADEPDWTKVMAIVNRIYELEPDYAAARILEGRVLFFEGRMEEAEFRYQSVSNQIGQDPIALLSLGEAYMELGYYDEAASTVGRARDMQPWNCRVQALGQFLEETAEQMAIAEAEYYDSWRHDAMRDKRFYHDGRRAMSPELAPPSGRYEREPVPMDDQGYEYEEEDVYQEARVRRGGRGTARPAQATPRQRGGQEGDNGREPRPERLPVRANDLAAGNGGGYRFDARMMTRPNPASSLSLSSNGLIDHDRSTRYPQDIQASVRPSLPQEPRRNSYPRTRVRLPERPEPQSRRREAENQAEGRDYEENPAQNNDRPREEYDRASPSVEPLDLGYTPGGSGLLDTRPPANYGWDEYNDNFNSEFGKGYDWMDENLREADTDDEGYLRFGMIEGAGNAYASIPVPEYSAAAVQTAADSGRIPPAFSFKSDDSPVILADVRSPGPDSREMPVRNANVYRRLALGKRPAEIIEKEPIAARLPADTAVMVPAGDGTVRRAEVTLPSSSRGVGMASDYLPGR